MAETDRSRLQTSVFAANINEKLDSSNRKLLAVKYPLLLSLSVEAGPDSRPASGTIVFASGSPERRSEGERALSGISTWATDISVGCPTPDASIKRCSADALTCTCSTAVGARSWLELEANRGGLIGGISQLVGCWLELNSSWDLFSSTLTLESVVRSGRQPSLGVL